MALRTPTTTAAFVSILAAGQVSGYIRVSVQNDAIYSLPESCGLPCTGSGVEPVGNACPKAGDVATADCQPHLPSYNGTICVAPVDAQCVLIYENVWGCVFPNTEYTTTIEPEAGGTINVANSGWTSNYKSGNHVQDDLKTKSPGTYHDTSGGTPLDIKCDVVTETTAQQIGSTMEDAKYQANQKFTGMNLATETSIDDTIYESNGYPHAAPTDDASTDTSVETSEDTSTSNGKPTSEHSSEQSGGYSSTEYTTDGVTQETTDVHTVLSSNYEPLTAPTENNDTEPGMPTTGSHYDLTGSSNESKTSSGEYITDTHHNTYTKEGTPVDRYTVGTDLEPSKLSMEDGQHYYVSKEPLQDNTMYPSRLYVRGISENQQTGDYWTYGSLNTEATEPYEEPESITYLTTEKPNTESSYALQQHPTYAATEKPCDTDTPEEGPGEVTIEPATDEVPTEPVITLPPTTLPPTTLPPTTLPPTTLPPTTLPPTTLPPTTLPPVTLPPVTVPPVTLPPVTVPPVTLPPVTV
ncbi:uncharacterized protein PHALS_14985, partial [Plasmopara halstedii]